MSKRINPISFAVLAALSACVGLVSEKDRPCPCAAGWICCTSDGLSSLCVAPGFQCPVGYDQGPSAEGGMDGGPPETTGGDDGPSVEEGSTGASPGVVDCIAAATPGRPVLLAMLPNPGGGIAVDSANLYAAPFESGVVTRISLSDCSTTTLNPVAEDTLAIDATNVYSFDSIGQGGAPGLLISCPKTGCGGTYTTIASGQTVAGVAVDDTSVYWTNTGSPAAVMKAPIAGGPATTLVASGSAEQIAVAGGYVIYTGWVEGGTAMLWALPATGGTPSVIFGTPVDDAGVVVETAGGSVQAMTVDATHVYFSTTNGVIGRIPIGGGSVATLATGQDNGLFAIAVDSTDVYWGTSSGSIYRTPIGAGPVTLLATIQGNIEGLTVDDTNVYFTTIAGGVYELRK